MEYGVEALARLSKVSVRTLHYYDEIGLLKPLTRMMNGRRYYGTEQFLRLLEILYFKEIGFSLKKIISILASKNLDKVSLLSVQKQVLKKEIDRLEKVAGSIDKTITHYKGCKMSDKELCEQFDNFQNKIEKYKKFYENQFDKETKDEATKNVADLSKEEREAYTEKCNELLKKTIEAINRNITPDSEEAQELMRAQFDLSSGIVTVTKESYSASRDCFLENSAMYSQYIQFHPQLPEFYYKAMGVFAAHTFLE